MKEFYDESPQVTKERKEVLDRQLQEPLDPDFLEKNELEEFYKNPEQLAPEYRETFGENFFRDINPYGLPLKKVRAQLAEELKELKNELTNLSHDSEKIDSLSEPDTELRDRFLGSIAEKSVWLRYLDDYFAKQNSDSFEDVEEYIKDKWGSYRRSNPKSN